MKAKRVVDLVHYVEWNAADHGANALDCDGADLFGLGLGVAIEARFLTQQQGLERIHAADVGRHRDDCHHALSESLCGRVGPVIADDDTGAGSCSLTPDNRVKVDESDLGATH